MRYLFNEIYDNLLFETKEYINFLISKEESSRKQAIENINKYVDDFIKNNIIGENNKFKFITTDEILYWDKKLDRRKFNKIVEKLKIQINEWFSPLTFDILEAGEISLNEYINWIDSYMDQDDDIGSDKENHSLNLFYRINKTEWRVFVNKNPIQVNAGDHVEFIGDNSYISREMRWDDLYGDIETLDYIETGVLNPYDNYWNRYIVRNFSSTCKFNVHGNIASLLSSTNFYELDVLLGYQCFTMLFYACENLISAENLILPFHNVNDYCYSNMFMNCKSLVYPPYMPIVSLGKGSCRCMFTGCVSLISTPELTATSIAEECYSCMFHGCTSLKKAYDLPATILFDISYFNMFHGCTSLKKAPKIAATEFGESSCSNMFSGCTSLKKAYKLMGEDLGNYCFSYMFYGCTSLRTPPEIDSHTLAVGCYLGMFENCNKLKHSPVLHAETLFNYCYQRMFKNCHSLSKITCFAINEINDSSLYEWVDGVGHEGVFFKNEDAVFNDGIHGIPYEWEVETIQE